ncbi:hypothetical protein OROMI_011708 [Orobanche minor]
MFSWILKILKNFLSRTSMTPSTILILSPSLHFVLRIITHLLIWMSFKMKPIHQTFSSTEFFPTVQSSLEKQIELNSADLDLKKTIFSAEIKLKERNQLMKEKTQKRRDQERILVTNLSNLTPSVRSFYEVMEANILKEWENDGYLGEFNGNGDSSTHGN